MREFIINESMVQKWRKKENDLCHVKKTTKKSFRENKARWPQLEGLNSELSNREQQVGVSLQSLFE